MRFRLPSRLCSKATVTFVVFIVVVQFFIFLGIVIKDIRVHLNTPVADELRRADDSLKSRDAIGHFPPSNEVKEMSGLVNQRGMDSPVKRYRKRDSDETEEVHEEKISQKDMSKTSVPKNSPVISGNNSPSQSNPRSEPKPKKKKWPKSVVNWKPNPSIQKLKGPIYQMNFSNAQKPKKKTNSVIGLQDYIPNSGKAYVWDSSIQISPEYRAALKAQGIEPTSDHDFLSPFISTPVVYPKEPYVWNRAKLPKKKLISCFMCPPRFSSIKNKYNRDFLRCPYCQCELDLEGKRISEADVLLVFVGDVGNRPPPPKQPGQIWVMLYWESPIHTPYPTPYELWKDKFNWTMNYRVESDIFYPYERLAWRDRDTLLSDQEYYSIARNKTKTAAWWVSHCDTVSKRMAYVREMQKYIDVDIYGSCGPFECDPKKLKNCEDMLTTTYRFYLSFENSMCTDYATEKFFRTFVFRSHFVPVVRSGFNYEKYVPKGMYVNAADFKTAKDLALHLKKLETDIDAYVRIIKEKDKLIGLFRKFDWCDVCEKVHTNKEVKVIPDIKEWSYKDACQLHREDVEDIFGDGK